MSGEGYSGKNLSISVFYAVHSAHLRTTMPVKSTLSYIISTSKRKKINVGNIHYALAFWHIHVVFVCLLDRSELGKVLGHAHQAKHLNLVTGP